MPVLDKTGTRKHSKKTDLNLTHILNAPIFNGMDSMALIHTNYNHIHLMSIVISE